MQPLSVGGMQTTQEALIKLLIEHGVALNRSHECADQVLSTIGIHQVQKALASPRPWMDLKARANACKPPIRLVLAEELKQMIHRKMQSDAPIGKKSNKSKQHRQSNPELRIRADQITVPHGVFRQQGGGEVGPLSQGQINAKSQGILVTNIEEALPYFTLQQPLSSEGIGLLVLDHLDARLPANHSIVRVPAICRATSEPIIAMAAL